MTQANPAARYSAVAIILHWAIAAAIVANILLGSWMHDAVGAQATQARAIVAFQLHKSLGLTVLVLSLLRLAWRLTHPVPPLPVAMPRWEKIAARAVHWAFYVVMIALPLSGWLYVSAQWRGEAPLNVPTIWFGLFEVPHLFGLNETAAATRQSFAHDALEAHELLASAAAALLALHIAAALKHHYVNRDEILSSMLPAMPPRGAAPPPRSRPRSLALRLGTLAIVAGMAALAFALVRTPERAAAGAGAVGELAESEWAIEPGSEILFSGEHAGTAFEGRFTRWRAGIRFDPADLAGSSVTAEVETASAQDGDPMHEETLPEAEWFDAANHPTARFRSREIRALAGGDGNRFALHGFLTIKDRELSLPPLTLTLAGDQLTIEGRVTISRREANLGMESDPNAEFVSDEIPVTVKVRARRRSP